MLPAFAYVLGSAIASPPTVTAVSPNVADTAGGGGIITITGTNFTGATGVTLGGTAATSVTVVNPTTITCIPGARAAASGLSVVVTTTAGSNGANTLFEYWSPAQITGIFRYLDSNKGITNVSGKVSAWLDQSSNAASLTQATAAQRPSVVASAFGTLPSVQGFAAADGVNQSSLGDASGFAAEDGFSMFAVVKTSGSKTTTTNPGTSVPMAIVGGAGWSSFGMSGGAIAYAKYDTGVVTAGSSLNNGTPKLIGVTVDSTPNIKLYSGATQQGSTFAPGGTPLNYYDHILSGYPGGTADGFPGDVGSIVVVSQVISSGDQTKLYAWSRQRFGVA